MKISLKEAGKTALIVVLICSLVLLFAASIPTDAIRSTPWLSTVLRPFAPMLGLPSAELAYVEDAQSVQSAAQPMSISVRNSTGRYTAQWNFTALDDAYEFLGSFLGRALDTAEAFTEVRPFQLTAALSQPGMCFDYGFLLPASLAASWLDSEPAQDMPDSTCYILALEKGQVWLYLQGESAYRALTQVDYAELLDLLEQFTPDGSQFAFEAGSHLRDLSILPETVPGIRAAVTASLITSRYTEALANSLGFNPYDDSRYTDSAGTTRFSETGGSLTITAAGDVEMTLTTERITATGSSLESLVEKARSLLTLGMDSSNADVRLYLSQITQDGDKTVCSFDYILGGIPVRWSGEAGAQVIFTGRAVTQLRMKAVRFVYTDTVQRLLPPVQAAAILPRNGALRLQYHAAEQGEVLAGWAK